MKHDVGRLSKSAGVLDLDAMNQGKDSKQRRPSQAGNALLSVIGGKTKPLGSQEDLSSSLSSSSTSLSQLTTGSSAQVSKLLENLISVKEICDRSKSYHESGEIYNET